MYIVWGDFLESNDYIRHRIFRITYSILNNDVSLDVIEIFACIDGFEACKFLMT